MTNRERRLEALLKEILAWMDAGEFTGWAAYIRREMNK